MKRCAWCETTLPAPHGSHRRFCDSTCRSAAHRARHHIDIPVDVREGEEWRSVVGYEGVYSVSSLGRVRRDGTATGARAGRVLRPGRRPSGGYLFVNLSRSNVQRCEDIHRLVTAAFLGPCPPGHEVNHIDADTENACVTNLEYVTRRENILHQHRLGRAAVGTAMPHAKLTDQAVREIRALRGIVPQTELARRYGVTQTLISQVQRRQGWAHVDRPNQEVA